MQQDLLSSPSPSPNPLVQKGLSQIQKESERPVSRLTSGQVPDRRLCPPGHARLLQGEPQLGQPGQVLQRDRVQVRHNFN